MAKRSKTVDIIGEINEEKLIEFVEAFREADETRGRVLVNICSPGGAVEAGTAIYELIRTSKNPVTTVGFCDVSSMAVLVLSAGDHRIVTEGTRLLLHDGSVNLQNALLKAHKHLAEHVRAHEWYARQLAARTGLPLDTWMQRLSDETFIGAETALDWKLVDEIRRYRPMKRTVTND